jgi:hypothetical protein
MSFLQAQKEASNTYNLKAISLTSRTTTCSAWTIQRNEPLYKRQPEAIMMAAKNLRIGLLASLLMLGAGTVDGAYAGFLNKGNPPPKQEDSPPVPETPESQAAGQRVDRAKTNLDQARKQLDAAKAVLKAADAEFRAAKADQEALALRTQAQRLADSSGLTGVPMDRVQSLPPVPKGTNVAATPGVTPADVKPGTPTEERIDPVTDNPGAQELDNSLQSAAPVPMATPLRPSAQ